MIKFDRFSPPTEQDEKIREFVKYIEVQMEEVTSLEDSDIYQCDFDGNCKACNYGKEYHYSSGLCKKLR